MQNGKNRSLLTAKALLADAFFWIYASFVIYFVIYTKMIAQIRRPEYAINEFLIAAAVGVGLAIILFFIKGCSIGKRLRGLYVPADETKVRPYLWLTTFFLLLTFLAGIQISQVSATEFFSAEGLGGAKRIMLALLSPNFDILSNTLAAAVETIYMAFIATVFALPFAFVFSFLAARNLMINNRMLFSIYTFTRFCMNITRSLEPLVWAIIFSVWVGIGPFAGMLALMLHSVASLSKLYSEQIENIDDGPLEAMIATGAHPLQMVWFGVVPQIVLPFLSFTIYRWDINVRMATIIGLVGGGGLGTLLMQYQGIAKWNEVGLIVIVIAIIVWAMDYASAKIRAAIK